MINLSYMKHLLRVSCEFTMWLQSKYNKDWDTELNRLLDTCEWQVDNRHTMKFLDEDIIKEVWCENYPYCFGYLYKVDGTNTRPSNSRPSRPSIKTMYKLKMRFDSAGKD